MITKVILLSNAYAASAQENEPFNLRIARAIGYGAKALEIHPQGTKEFDQPNDWFALAPRWEYYDDEHGFTSGAAQKMKEVTVTGEFKHKDGVIARLEYRHDYSDIPFFLKNTRDFRDRQNTFTVGLRV